jgi:hypothetical protein
MKLITHSPKESFSDILQKYKPVDTDFHKFKTELQTFIGSTGNLVENPNFNHFGVRG